MRTARAQNWAPRGLTAIGALLIAGSSALAAGIGQPAPWQMDRQVAATVEAADLHLFEQYLHGLAFIISLLVLGLILYCVYRFREKANPVPSRTTHNTLIEVAWTIIPVLILVGIAIPSFRMLRTQLSDPQADVTIKAIGHAWYWSYEYPQEGENGGFTFDANIDEEQEPKLLAVDNEVVVPVNKVIKVQVTSTDVIHAWTIPSFGGKVDAVPGRLNQLWFKADREGTYYGQCSELCGMRHAFMPIAVKVVSEQAYSDWLKEAKTKFARIENGSKLADAR